MSFSLNKPSSIKMSFVIGESSIIYLQSGKSITKSNKSLEKSLFCVVAAISILWNSAAVCKKSLFSCLISSSIVCTSCTVGSTYGSSDFIWSYGTLFNMSLTICSSNLLSTLGFPSKSPFALTDSLYFLVFESFFFSF